ncbi:autotransporter outer membrane beta-barrel domain-containing protein, partial [Cronobacter dublinensis]|uniref:autotransporter outer membrane beta-barrel domain-containing protein n=1 Tax=Cronobacter dublinensis TaxID=413497 RepID=UPI001319C103
GTVFGGGTQLVEGTASGTSISDGGVQLIAASGQAKGTLVNSGGVQRVDGQSFDAVINNGGQQLVDPYGWSRNTVINAGGTQILANQAVAVSTVMNGGEQHVNNGAKALATRLLGGTQNIGNGGKAYETRVEKGGVQNVNSGGYTYGGTISTGGRQNVFTGGTTDFTFVDGGLQVVDGTSIVSIVKNGGRQIVNKNANAEVSIVIDGGVQDVYGTTTGSEITRAEQRVYEGANVTSTWLNDNAKQTVYNGAVVTETRNRGGEQNLLSGARAVNTVMETGAVQNIAAGATAVNTSLINGSVQNVRGTADGADFSANTVQNVYRGGVAKNTGLYSTGVQNIYNGGQTFNTNIENGGIQNVLTGGTATSTTINLGGTQNVNSGGTVISTIIKAGGIQNVNDGAIVIDNTVIGDQVVNKGGTVASSTVSENGSQSVTLGGTAIATTVTKGGMQVVRQGGVADQTIIHQGGMLAVADDAAATSIDLNSGAGIIAGTNTTVDGKNALGQFSIANKIANNLLLESGGLLSVAADGIANNTVVQDGGKLSVADGGILTGTTELKDGSAISGNVINTGKLSVTTDQSDNAIAANISGTGSLYKEGDGKLTVSGVLNQTGGTWLQSGTLVFSGLQAVTDVVAQLGTSLQLTNGSTLTGMIDPTDLTVDAGSTWLMTDDSLLNNLTLGGSIDYQAPTGAFVPKTLTVTNLTGNGGTITLNTLFQGGTATTDSLIIDGGTATGNTRIAIRNQGGLGARTTGDGIQVVNAINGATTTDDAFSLANNLQAGAYNYSLRQGAGSESWYLTTAAGNGNENGPQNYRSAMYLYSSLYAQAMDYDSALLGSLDSRRYAARTPGEDGSNLWARFQAGQLSHDHGASDLRNGNTPESKGGYTFLQIGSDLWRATASSMEWGVGIYGAAGLSAVDVQRSEKSKAGTVRDDAYSAGLYVNGVHESGWWVDVVAQGTRHNFDTNPRDGDGLKTHGWGYVGSFETGLPFDIGSGLVLEPQVQYQYRGVNLKDGDDDAADVQFGDGHSQQVRAGLRFGNNATLKTTGNPPPVSWWVRPSFIQTFDSKGDVNVSAPGVAGSEVSFSPDQDGTAAALDVGIDGQIRDNVTLGVRAGYTKTIDDAGTGGYGGQVTLKVSF